MHAGDSDAALVEAARRGDSAAFAELLVRHRPLVLALCRRLLGDASLAEDAAQEAAVQAMLSLESLRQAERFGPWLAGIGLNVCRLWLRSQARERTMSEVDVESGPAAVPAGTPGDPVARSEAAELAGRVRAAVDELPRGQRAAVQLFYLSDLSYAETADSLGIGVGAVRTRLHKARGALREQLRLVWKETYMLTAETEQQVEHICSFCGKKNYEVHRMIAGPNGVVICDECIALCNEIIAKEQAKDAAR